MDQKVEGPVVSGQSREAISLTLPVRELCSATTRAISPAIDLRRHYKGQLFRSGVRRWPEQDAVDDREHRGCGPDPDRQRQHCYCRESWILQELAEGEAKVVHILIADWVRPLAK